MNTQTKTFHVEQQEKLTNCPVCGSGSFLPGLMVQDHSHTKELFAIVECAECGFRFTNPRPRQEAIGRYYEFSDYISHTNSNKGVLNRVYKMARSYALVKKLQLVLRITKKKGPILDYGCGTGEFLNVCKKAGWEVTGVEPSKSAREFATTQYNLNVVTPNNQLPTHHYRVITLWHVLEHLPDLNEAFIKFAEAMTVDGSLIIAVPNHTSYEATKYKEFWAAYDVPRHFYHFRPQDIETLAEKHGFKVIDVLPMLLDAFYISLLSEKHKTGKQNFIKAFFTGLRSNIHGLKHKNRYSSQIYVLKKRNKAI